jgi:hypothetical protein
MPELSITITGRVTIEVFDENVDEDTADAFAIDFLVGKEYGL